MKKYYNSKPILNDAGNLKRTGLPVNGMVRGVLLPGDPHRSELMSKQFVNPEFVSKAGTYVAYKGETANGKDVWLYQGHRKVKYYK